MVKIRKKSSKRVGLREKYCVDKKVKSHHKKMRKAARKLGEVGLRPRPSKTKMVIPNSFPGKEELINEMEA
jgi:nuclear GTP-binding protein